MSLLLLFSGGDLIAEADTVVMVPADEMVVRVAADDLVFVVPADDTVRTT